MTDREIVLIQLEGVGNGLDMAGYHADAQCIRDALALLREQKTEPHLTYCPNCGAAVEVTR